MIRDRRLRSIKMCIYKWSVRRDRIINKPLSDYLFLIINLIFQIGLMRKGILLSEAPPQEIMDSCNADTLESAFLTLSQKQIVMNTVI